MEGPWTEIDGGVTAPAGFQAGAVNCGIRSVKPDVALLVSDSDAVLAGTFTSNRLAAAPVALCRERVALGLARAVIVNSGNANAATGAQGRKDADRMAALTAEALGTAPEAICVCSTGTIGVRMPMEKLEAGIRAVAGALSPDGGAAAARAIMTTDLVPKEMALALTIEGTPVRIGGMAKGSGMIDPNMATMLAYVTTDAAVEAAALQGVLRAAVEDSFNRITVDGDESTNDTVLCLANGAAGNTPLQPDHPDWAPFVAAVREVCGQLARMIVKDGEGATKFVTVGVQGAASDAEARQAARAIANSLLVKTSWFGCDPNWGRIYDVVGYAGVQVDPDTIEIRLDDVVAVRDGLVAGDTDLTSLEAVLKQDEFTVLVDLHVGRGNDTVYTCDCSYDYVRINAEYTT
ncbi:MAG: bifunctional glutamate N-acetyltransferase/amino-acid acetyltransferase ArgJ [Verrucomicrobia bacterium]|mgnify:CR=1 FL=1|jgi:glutamate N-acetyltransferase / amino-acid N-acetyltransferase|nr:bifunctional glutamate N-acetyltransferase/amino-acid acetyltransferase ArgJ [Verrucomicrobiota bacterium]MBT7067882.1 bifunctional glutamate N-acetyltransferase/amino-acid acetyltransferase ArgJ [Verrucomicrobiota bacterium]MBT7699358.1 bifunctional glutamate N-acetyltransferase/amino-acid acetyltransferase ArgJ [Verrucomicrobiota bacterium]